MDYEIRLIGGGNKVNFLNGEGQHTKVKICRHCDPPLAEKQSQILMETNPNQLSSCRAHDSKECNCPDD